MLWTFTPRGFLSAASLSCSRYSVIFTPLLRAQREERASSSEKNMKNVMCEQVCKHERRQKLSLFFSQYYFTPTDVLTFLWILFSLFTFCNVTLVNLNVILKCNVIIFLCDLHFHSLDIKLFIKWTLQTILSNNSAN